MLKRFTTLLIVFTVSSQSFAAGTNILFGTVDRVVDGDTLVFKTSGAKTLRIRLADIDTPEMDQPWGEEAKAALSVWVEGERGRIDIVDTDRYGRSVATVWIDDKNVNRRLVKEGHAWVYRKYLRDRTLLSLEANAQAQELGLWSDKKAIAPEAWRSGQRTDKSLPVSVESVTEPVKKSRSGICHVPGSTYYSRTKYFTSFENLESCLESGGRLPKR